jgi:hypothetical protein
MTSRRAISPQRRVRFPQTIAEKRKENLEDWDTMVSHITSEVFTKRLGLSQGEFLAVE